jgi:phage gpG-like protein
LLQIILRFYSVDRMISIEVKAPTVQTDLRQPINKSLRQSALLVRRDASKNAPFKSGTLRRSLTEKVYSDSAIVWTNVVYARIHELWWTITPKKWPYLTFKVWWRWVRTKKVTIKARPYLKPALEDNIKAIGRIFAENIVNFIYK